MELFEIAVTILAAVLTYQGWKNERWMKMGHHDIQDLIRQTQDLVRQIRGGDMGLGKEGKRDEMLVRSLFSFDKCFGMV